MAGHLRRLPPGGMTDYAGEHWCAVETPRTGQFVNWPVLLCLLDLGHEGDHEATTAGGVTWCWPCTADDVRVIASRPFNVVGLVFVNHDGHRLWPPISMYRVDK